MWEISKEFDFCYGHRVWSQALNVEFSLDSCLMCRHLHGHQGKVIVYLKSDTLKSGMVTDFKHLNWFKKFLDDVIDHKFIIDINDPLFENLAGDILLTTDNNLPWYENLMVDYNSEYDYARPDLDHITDILSKLNISDAQRQALFEKYEGLVIVNFVPTSENLCKWWFEVANKMLKELGIDVVAVEYWETPKSHCKYQPN